VADGDPAGIDLALLEITPVSGQAPVDRLQATLCGRVDRQIPGRIGECVAVGYPKHAARPEAPFTTGEVDGWIPAASGLADAETGRTEGFLMLKAEGTPPRPLPTSETRLRQSQWAGMSGAAVFAGGLLVGVVAEHHLPEGDGSLTVVPIAWVEQLPDADRECLLSALGVESVARMEVLTAGTPAHRWESVLPDPPTVLVERPGVLDSLRHALRASDGNPVLVVGMGGAGKSVLAAQLARAIRDRSNDLAAEYPAGVAWATVGRERPVAAIQLELARAFGEDQPDLGGDWRSGRARLQQLVAAQRGLLVLDDVWTQDRYEPFRLTAPGVQILITTRNQALAGEVHGVLVPAGELEKDQSRQLLAAMVGLSPQELPAEAGDLLLLVGDLALGVAMVGAIARERGPQAWPGLLRRLRERQLGRIAHKFADNYEHATLLRAVDVAVDDLDIADQQRWAELAVFAGQGGVPEPAMAALWSRFDQDDLDTGDRIARFLARSLLQAVGDSRYRLHDLQYDVAFLRLGTDSASAQEGLVESHARLVDSYAQRVADATGAFLQAGWAEFVAGLARKSDSDLAWQVADDGYLLGHLVGHLCRAGRAQDAAELLAGYDWITIGLARRGLAQLVSDYGEPAGDTLRTVRDALGRSARALSADPGCLPDQLLGRLADAEDAILVPLLARLRAEQAHRPLQIIRSGLQPASGSLVHVLTGHQDKVKAVAVTGDGTRAVTTSDDETAIVWDLAAGTVLHTLTGHPGQVWAVAVTGDGTWAVTTSTDGTVIVWDLASGTPLHTLTRHQSRFVEVAVTGDGTRAVTTSDDGTVIVWDLASGTPLHTTLTRHDSRFVEVAVTGDGTWAVTSDDGTALVWDLTSGTMLHTLTGRPGQFWAVAVTGDGTRAVTGGTDGTVIVWDLASGTPLHTRTGHQEKVKAVAVTGDGTRAVTTSTDGTAIVWDLASGTPLHTRTGRQDTITAVAVTGDGTRAVITSTERTAIVWDLASGTVLHTLTGHQDIVTAVAVSGDGTRAVTTSWDRTAIVWDLASGTPLPTLTRHQGPVRAVAVTGDGTQAVTASEDQTAIVWDLASGAALHTLTGHQDRVWAVAVTGDGTQAVTASEDQTAIVWDLASGTPLHTLTGHHHAVVAVAVTGDGTQAVTGGNWDLTAIVWDLASGTPLHTLTARGPVRGVAVNCDGTRAVTGGIPVIVWDLASGAALHTLTGHQGPGEVVAVSGDGTRAVTGGNWDRTVIVWDLASGAALHTLAGHQGRITAAAVSGDGGGAVTTSDDGTVIVWDLAVGKLATTWHCDTLIPAVAWAAGKPIFVVGDNFGGVHILRLRTLGANTDQSSPAVR
jgi:WD40 repeat protein